ncbi:MAG TPA: hypothetical protein VFS09_06530 [Candidatus Eisenbacteria bacterium]|nr:hypothetical protein [Candidatus Eisenbacteria bacterium]
MNVTAYLSSTTPTTLQLPDATCVHKGLIIRITGSSPQRYRVVWVMVDAGPSGGITVGCEGPLPPPPPPP